MDLLLLISVLPPVVFFNTGMTSLTSFKYEGHTESNEQHLFMYVLLIETRDYRANSCMFSAI
jgi:hypothetical protein